VLLCSSSEGKVRAEVKEDLCGSEAGIVRALFAHDDGGQARSSPAQ
jgi:hypothetical protein